YVFTPREQKGEQAADVFRKRMKCKIARGQVIDVGFRIITGESI
ncbi:transcriptional regulator, partial [Salmonella enterica subsp. enterica serovar Enteritidis]